MSLLPPNQKFVDEFFRAVELLQEGYHNSSFSYVAIKSNDTFVLVQGKLFLNARPSSAPFSHFQSKNVRAGCYSLSDLSSDPRKVVDQLLSGKLATPHGELTFPTSDAGTYGASYIPFHPDALRTQRRISVLQLFGGQPSLICQPDIDWEIKASDTPYDGLQELMFEYLLGPLTSTPINVEIAAFNIVEVDTLNSKVNGNEAIIRIIATEGADTNKVKIGYRVNNQGRISIRSTIVSKEVKWSSRDGAKHGEVVIEVPAAALVNAVVSYNGIAQHHWWFSDPATSQNARRAVYEAFDTKLEVLKDIFAKAQGRNPEARQLEAAAAWLFWMLGFSVAHFGGTPRMQEAADIIATTPAGHFAVIECTTGLLKAENKLALLHDRTELVRRSLAVSNQGHLRVIPAIVTSKAKDEVKPDMEQAERLGILVITREDFEQVINRTLILPNADRLYEEAERSIRAAQAKYESQPALPFSNGPANSALDPPRQNRADVAQVGERIGALLRSFGIVGGGRRRYAPRDRKILFVPSAAIR